MILNARLFSTYFDIYAEEEFSGANSSFVLAFEIFCKNAPLILDFRISDAFL